MLIRSLKVTGYRGVAGPVELTLGPGLNVLHGPNESGKSTLLEALRNALLVKARSSSEFHRAMAPHGGGTPEVEVGFHRAGVSYLLTKRFAAAGSTRLVETRGGGTATTHEDDAAEDRLREVLGLADAGRSRDPLSPEHTNFWPLLFVEQAQSARAPGDELAESGRGSLSAALEALSGEALDGGGEGATLARLAEERYLEHFTAGGSPRRSAGSRRAQVAAELEEAQAELTELRERDAAQAEALAGHRRAAASLHGLDAQLPALEGSADRAARAAREAAVRGAERGRAEEAVQTRSLERKQAQERAAQRGRLVEAVAAAGRTLEEAEAAVPAEPDAAEATTGSEEPGEAAAAEAALRAAELHREALRLGAEAAEAAARVQRAEAAARRLAEVAEKRAAIDVVEADAKKLRKLEDTLAAARAADAATRAAAAPSVRVEVAGDAEAAAAVTAGEPEPLDAAVEPGGSEIFAASVPLSVNLPGRLRVTITPPAVGADAAEPHRRKLARALTDAGVASADEAATLAAEARDLDAQLGHLREALALHAPEGVEVARAHAAGLGARRAAREAERDGARAGDAAPLPGDADAADEEVDAARRVVRETRERAEAARAARVAADRAAADARQARALAAQAAGRAAADHAAAERALAAHREEHGDAAALAAAAQAAADAEAAAAEALTGLPEADTAAADADASRAGRALEVAKAEAQALRDQLNRLDERLHAADSVGLPDRLAAAELAAERAGAASAALDAEAAAARRLHETLTRHRLAARERFLSPLRAEVDRLLPRLFPGARSRFDAAFGGLQVERGGTPEDHAELSMGGREQLGVLVRLAMARVLAGEPDPGDPAAGVLPLLLDDPLTHTDEDRFESMAAVLSLAAPPLQVLVATCHWARHRALGVDPTQVFDLERLKDR